MMLRDKYVRGWLRIEPEALADLEFCAEKKNLRAGSGNEKMKNEKCKAAGMGSTFCILHFAILVFQSFRWREKPRITGCNQASSSLSAPHPQPLAPEYRGEGSLIFCDWSIALTLIAVALLTNVTSSQAQESSLFRQAPSQPMMTTPMAEMKSQAMGSDQMQSSHGELEHGNMDQGGVGLTNASWTYTPPPQSRTFRIQDLVTIRVDELTRARADGTAQVRKNTLYDAILKDWIGFRDGDLGTDSQSTGDPRINAQSNQLYRASSTLESRETLAFSVAARVVDIQPNGNLVLEARKTIWLNDNTWQTALSGICRAQDIAPDNVVLSRDLLDLQIRKNESGQIRDGYKRGWFTRWLDQFNPF